MTERWLVIDDSSTIQRVIKLAFQDYDVFITEADSCLEASRDIQRLVPQLVIADAAVTGAQSVQDFVNLRNQAPQTPFIILEGSYDNIDDSHFRGAGFFHFLKKPFDAAQLLEVTRTALGRALPFRNANSVTLPPPPPGRAGSGKPFAEGNAAAAAFELELNEARSTPANGRTVSFSLDDEIETDTRMPMKAWDNTPVVSQSPAPSNVHGLLEPMLKEEMERWVRATVEDYCRKHFPSLARDMITREIEKLTQERSRLLVEK